MEVSERPRGIEYSKIMSTVTVERYNFFSVRDIISALKKYNDPFHRLLENRFYMLNKNQLFIS